MADRLCDLNRNESSSLDNLLVHRSSLLDVDNAQYLNDYDSKLSCAASVRALPPVDDCVQLVCERASPVSFYLDDESQSDGTSYTMHSSSSVSVPATPLYGSSSLTYSYGTISSMRIEPSPERSLDEANVTVVHRQKSQADNSRPSVTNRSSSVYSMAKLAKFIDEDISFEDDDANVTLTDITSNDIKKRSDSGGDLVTSEVLYANVRDMANSSNVKVKNEPLKKSEPDIVEKLDMFFGESKPGFTDLETAVYKQLVLGPAAKQQSVSVASALNEVHSRGKKFTDDVQQKSKKASALSLAPKPLVTVSSSSKLAENCAEPSRVKSTISTWRGKVARQFRRQTNGGVDVVDDGGAQGAPQTFGVPLDTCVISRGSEHIPLVVEVCTHLVEKLGSDSQGIYRVPGHTSSVNALVEEINANSMCVRTDNVRWNDVNVVASLLKLFFRRLPDSLVTDQLYPLFIGANRLSNAEKSALRIKRLLYDLPELNRATLRHLACHLHRIAGMSSVNKMDAHNLAIMFGPSVIRLSTESTTDMVRDIEDQSGIMKRLIENHEWYFGDWTLDADVPVTSSSGDQRSEVSNMQLLASAESLVAMQKVSEAAAQNAALSVPGAEESSSGFLRLGSGRMSRKKSKANLGDAEDGGAARIDLDREVELRRVPAVDKSSVDKSHKSPALSGVDLARKVSMSTSRGKKINRRFTEKPNLSEIKIVHERTGALASSNGVWKAETSWKYREEEQPSSPPPDTSAVTDVEVKRYPAYNFVDTTIKSNRSMRPIKNTFQNSQDNLHNSGNTGSTAYYGLEAQHGDVFDSSAIAKPAVRMRGRLDKDTHKSKRYSEADLGRYISSPLTDLPTVAAVKDKRSSHNVVIKFPEDRRYYVLRLEQPGVLFHNRKSERYQQDRVGSLISDINGFNISSYTSDFRQSPRQNKEVRSRNIDEYLADECLIMRRQESSDKTISERQTTGADGIGLRRVKYMDGL